MVKQEQFGFPRIYPPTRRRESPLRMQQLSLCSPEAAKETQSFEITHKLPILATKHRRQIHHQQESKPLKEQPVVTVEERVALQGLLPETYRYSVERGDRINYINKVLYAYRHVDMPSLNKDKRFAKTRQWIGLGLGSVAFWVPPWPSVVGPLLALRTASAMAPYFFLNLPDSAIQYKQMAKIVGKSYLGIALLPFYLARRGVWEVKRIAKRKKRVKEIESHLMGKYQYISPELSQKRAKALAIFEESKKLEEGRQTMFEEIYPQAVETFQSVYPSWTKEQTINVLSKEAKKINKRAVHEALSFLLVSSVIPAAIFGLAASTGASVAAATGLPVFLPFVAASLGSLIIRKSFARLYIAAKQASLSYTKEKLQREISVMQQQAYA